MVIVAPAVALSGAPSSLNRQSSHRTWLSSHHTPSPAVMPSLQFFDQLRSRRRRSGSRTTTSSASGPSAFTHLAFRAAANANCPMSCLLLRYSRDRWNDPLTNLRLSEQSAAHGTTKVSASVIGDLPR